MKSIMNYKGQVILGAFIITSLFVLWEYSNGGVVTHHLLARPDLPGISNWWGLLTIPLLTWLTLTLIQRRHKSRKSASYSRGDENKTLKRFLSALIFGVIASLLWKLNLESILPYFILSPLLIAIFKPIHLPEYLLGFVFGMLFTFGGLLSILVGTVLLILCFLINKLIQFLRSFFFYKNPIE